LVSGDIACDGRGTSDAPVESGGSASVGPSTSPSDTSRCAAFSSLLLRLLHLLLHRIRTLKIERYLVLASQPAVVESALFQAPAKGSRRELARLLRAHDAGERFGVLRAVAVGHEVRWVCERHFVELRRCCLPAPPPPSRLQRR